jgi:hypothetical protein
MSKKQPTVTSKESILIGEIRTFLGQDRLKLNPPVVISNEDKIVWQIETATAVNVHVMKYFRYKREDMITIDLDILETPVLEEILRQLKEYA